VDVTCTGCGNAFRTQLHQKRKFCTRECCFAFETALTRARKNEKKAASLAAKLAPCCICGQPATSKCCGVECNKEYARRQARKRSQAAHVVKAANCSECGAVFKTQYGNKHRTYCSTACGRRKASRIGKSSRRARSRSAIRELVDPIEICERDGWRCHMCHRVTPKRLRGTSAKRAPEIDHILPLAAGGTHTRDNLACACRDCNQSKGATPIGQMRLDVSPMVSARC
jgi:hypothetical protein